MQSIMNRLGGWDDGVAIDGRLISGAIESAQKRVEAFHFESRKHVTDYDNVMNKQRQVIYNLRSRILTNQGVRDEVLTMIDDLVEEAVITNCSEKIRPMNWDLKALQERLAFLFLTEVPLNSDGVLEQQKIFDMLRTYARNLYQDRMARLAVQLGELEAICNRPGCPFVVRIQGFEEKPFAVETVEQDTMLESVDHLWKAHLQEMDHLREGIDLRGYGQKNPLHEYQREGFLMFQHLLDDIRETVVRKLFFYQAPEPAQLLAHLEQEQRRRAEVERQMRLVHTGPDGSNEVDAATAEAAKSSNADEQRAKMEALRKERRKARK